jgi:hypothetical protein
MSSTYRSQHHIPIGTGSALSGKEINMNWRKRFSVLAMLAILFFSTSVPAAGAKPALDFDPEDFVREVTNPYFPLKPGTTFVYKGESDGAALREVLTVTNKTKKIMGVRTRVVRHLVYEDGVLIEEAFDWFAQDEDGNVWYFGEDTKDFDENGNVISTEGSWQAGVGGAKPGIVMLAKPKKGKKYKQENAPGVAEDTAQVIGYKDSFCVPYKCFEDVLVTKEWNPLEPGFVEHKYYAKGVGFIYSIAVKGGDEEISLVRVKRQRED